MTRRTRRAKHEPQPERDEIDLDIATLNALELALARAWLGAYRPAIRIVLDHRHPRMAGVPLPPDVIAMLMVFAIGMIAQQMGVDVKPAVLAMMRDVVAATPKPRAKSSSEGGGGRSL